MPPFPVAEVAVVLAINVALTACLASLVLVLAYRQHEATRRAIDAQFAGDRGKLDEVVTRLTALEALVARLPEAAAEFAESLLTEDRVARLRAANSTRQPETPPSQGRPSLRAVGLPPAE